MLPDSKFALKRKPGTRPDLLAAMTPDAAVGGGYVPHTSRSGSAALPRTKHEASVRSCQRHSGVSGVQETRMREPRWPHAALNIYAHGHALIGARTADVVMHGRGAAASKLSTRPTAH